MSGLRSRPLERPASGSSKRAKRLTRPSVKGEASRVLEGLETRYSATEGWSLIPNVSSGDVDELRYADAVAVALSPMEGPRLHGFEVKVSRADWLRELQHPEKSAPIRAFCSAWWVVVPYPAKRIILSRNLELPEGVGLLEVDHGRCLPLQHPVEREAPPVPWVFVQALLRAGAHREEREASADFGAPMRPVVRRLSRSHVALGCGHSALEGLVSGEPPRAPCLSCRDHLDTDPECIEAALRDARPEDRRRYAVQLGVRLEQSRGAA